MYLFFETADIIVDVFKPTVIFYASACVHQPLPLFESDSGLTESPRVLGSPLINVFYEPRHE